MEYHHQNGDDARKPAAAELCGEYKEQHRHSHKGNDAGKIKRMIQGKPQILQISRKELEHEMIAYILTCEMGVLCREVIAEGKRTDHSHMHGEIAENLKSHTDCAATDIKTAVHHEAYEDGKDDKKCRY